MNNGRGEKCYFEERFPNFEEFKEVYKHIIKNPRKIDYQCMLLKNKLGEYSRMFKRESWPICVPLSMSVFASLIGKEGQRLHRQPLFSLSARQRYDLNHWKGLKADWYRELIWNLPKKFSGLPCLIVTRSAHDSNATFIGKIWNLEEKKKISNYVFYDFYSLPKLTFTTNPDSIRCETVRDIHILEMTIPKKISLDSGSMKKEMLDNFYFVKINGRWKYISKEVMRIFECIVDTGDRSDRSKIWVFNDFFWRAILFSTGDGGITPKITELL